MSSSASSDVSHDSCIKDLEGLAAVADYSLLNTLTPDPHATETGEDYRPRQVFSGHYVPVKPSALPNADYVCHSPSLFEELGFDESFADSEDFKKLFSGDLSALPESMQALGWATGYALSIYGTEYIQQCPFQTGNGYGDGRAMSVLEIVSREKRWEFQLKGGGRTPYCRGADGRAVLRSSVREFLAQEHMHALGIPTSRSLCLFRSLTEHVDRPWYSEGAQQNDPNMMVSNPVAITTRVAPSFLRVGQVELFGRRARKHEYPEAIQELEAIVLHLIDREYSQDIADDLPLEDKVISLLSCFSERLIYLVTHWIRVGYCQGNFNSDNCAGGGFTLDYGPFGFCEIFEPFFQPWTGGGRHFSFLNQPAAAKENFKMLCVAVKPLLEGHVEALQQWELLQEQFPADMQTSLNEMWAQKLGLRAFDPDVFAQLLGLMVETPVDYTLFFRELSELPESVTALSESFYRELPEDLLAQWQAWLDRWQMLIGQSEQSEMVSARMKQVNPKYTWREWLVVPAYQMAEQGDYSDIKVLQKVLTSPYDEQGEAVDKMHYRRRPQEFYRAGGVSHYSCSS